MSNGLYLVACAGHGTLERVLLLAGAVAQGGGSVVVLTYTPGRALRRTFFGLEVVVRRDDDLAVELLRLESLAVSRGAGVLLLDDARLGDEHAAAVRVLSQQLAVARWGPPLSGGAAGELPIDPYHLDPGPPAQPDGPAPAPPAQGGCYGLGFLPVHPNLRPLRERRLNLSPAQVPDEVRRVTIACSELQPELELDLAARALEALSVWRPTLQITVLCEPEMSRIKRACLDHAMRQSRHDVTLRPLLPEPQVGEELLCDLAIVDDPDRAAIAAYLGTPVVVLSTTEAAARKCEALQRSGVAIHLPSLDPDALPPAMFADLMWTLCADQGRRTGLSAAARRVIDGYGAERVAAALFELNQARHGRRNLW